jgi:hypothetical protein
MAFPSGYTVQMIWRAGVSELMGKSETNFAGPFSVHPESWFDASERPLSLTGADIHCMMLRI